VFSVFADPAWLAVLLTALAGYDKIKANVPVITEDVRRLFDSVVGLTERQRQLLEIAVRLSIDRWLELGEQQSAKLSRRFARMRRRLLGDEGEPPEIRVLDVANKDVPW
jgi:hypothetical protein